MKVLQSYRCSVVGRNVALILSEVQDAHVLDPQNEPERFKWVTIRRGFRDCQYRLNCPAVEPPGHVGRIKWELCPGREEYEYKDPS